MVAVPAFMYAADVWYTGISLSSNGRCCTGSVAASKKLNTAQHHAAKTIMGYWPSFTMHIATSKDKALEAITVTHKWVTMAVYCDGSSFQDGVGASAVLYVNGEEDSHLSYHLSSAAEHTVYKAEIVGISMGLHMLTKFNKQL
ncbi:hypothetical protein J132_04088 [Termitomyces sp. J132]|nr:hypothetical protein J132_04088 [Termitomyces sp. J132]